MKKSPIQWLTVFVLLALLLIPVFSVAAQGGGLTTYLPFISNQTPEPTPLPPAVKRVGPSGGTFPTVALDPSDSTALTLYVGTWGWGVQKSLDGGLTWQAMNAGLGTRYIQSLVVRSDGWVYAGTYGRGMYRSKDGGASWTAINTGDTLVAGLIVYDIEIDPINTQTIYISGRTPGSCATPDCDLNGYVYKSINGGDSWSQKWKGMNYFTNGDYSYDVEVDPTNSLNVYLATHRNSVYKSINAAASWYLSNSGISDPNARKLLILSNAPKTVYNSTYDSGGVFKTTDGGASWVQKSSGLPSPLYSFALSRDSKNPNDIYLGTGDRGVYKSTTLAESWAPLGLSSNFIWAFGQVPGTSPAVYAATGGNGLQYSADGQNSWQSRHEGIFNTNISGLATFNGVLYAGVNGGGVFKTTDHGDTWRAVKSGLENLNIQYLQVISGSLYAVTTTNLYRLSSDGASWSVAKSVNMAPPADLPADSTTETAGSESIFSTRSVFPEEEQYLLQGNMGGSTANGVDGTASALRPITAVTHNWDTFWYGTAGGGLYRDTSLCAYADRSIYALYTNPYTGAMYADLTAKTSGYAVIRWKAVYNVSCGDWDTQDGIPGATVVYSFYSIPSRTFAASSTGVYYLPNDSSTWLSTNGFTGAVYALAANPNNANQLYAATAAGAYVSTDGGLNWSLTPKAELKNIPFLSVSFDPANSNIVYFGSREGSTYRWDKILP